MNGEIITEGEMREAMRLADDLKEQARLNPPMAPILDPAASFLYRLAWKGQER